MSKAFYFKFYYEVNFALDVDSYDGGFYLYRDLLIFIDRTIKAL